jgi:hypothetical protein
MIIDVQPIDFKTSKMLFLPLQKRKKYYSKLGNNMKTNLYLRINDFPSNIRTLFDGIITKMSDNSFLFLEESTIESICPPLDTFETCLKTLKCKQRIRKWMKLITQQEKWDVGHLSTGKQICLYLCGILFHFAMNEYNFCKQFRLFQSIYM